MHQGSNEQMSLVRIDALISLLPRSMDSTQTTDSLSLRLRKLVYASSIYLWFFTTYTFLHSSFYKSVCAYLVFGALRKSVGFLSRIKGKNQERFTVLWCHEYIDSIQPALQQPLDTLVQKKKTELKKYMASLEKIHAIIKLKSSATNFENTSLCNVP